MSLRVSGCMNGCAMHACADVGLEGIAVRSGQDWLPAYRVWVGGAGSETLPRIGNDLGVVPARRAPECVAALLCCYTEAHKSNESFSDFLGRTGSASLRDIVTKHALDSTHTDVAELAVDWSEEGRYQSRHIKAVGVC